MSERVGYNNVSKVTKAGRIIGLICCYIFLIVTCFTCVFPFLWMVLSSLKTPAEAVNTLTLTFFSKDPQWGNYPLVFEKIDIFRGLLNTLAIEFTTIPFCVFMSGLSAFAFSKMELKHKDVHLMVQLSALMIPYACVVLPLYRAYYKLNLTDTLWPLILPSLFGGVSMMFFFVQFQRSISNAIFEAAKVDGAGYMRQYVSIMMPIMGPAIAAQVIFMFVGNWNDYFAPSLYLTIEKAMTLQLMIKSLSDSKVDLPVSFAGAVVASIPLYIIYIIFQRYFIEGMAISGVKG
ncbi:MAG: carbohydrate ABC transporter permease [Candidatus Borkfalkiaceae bacterium]|nr:carbohydrate ABC transporter permease [Christensenellaceae bacterium]